MNKSIKKFILFLENKRDELYSELEKVGKKFLISFYKEHPELKSQNEKTTKILKKQEDFKIIQEKIEEIDHFLSLHYFFKEFNEFSLMFNDFNKLSKILEDSDLSSKDKTNVILYYVKNNIKSYSLNEKDFVISSMHDEISKMLDNDNILSQIILKEEKKLTKDEELLIDEKADYLEQMKHIEVKKMSEPIMSIKENYFDKKGDLNNENIEIILKSLNELGITEKVLESVREWLSKKLNSKTPVKEYTTFKTNNESKKIENDAVSLKEEKEYRKELKILFNFDKMETVKKDLTFDEIIRCAALALYFGYEKSKIKMFFFKMGVRPFYTEEYDDLTEIYDKFKGQIEFYKDKYDLYEEIEMLDEIVSYLKENYDEYWNKELKNKLDSISKKLKNNFTQSPCPDPNKPDKYIDQYQYELSLANQEKEKLEKKDVKGKTYKLLKK